MRSIYIIFAALLLLSGCSPHSSKEFQKEGERLCLDLIEILQEVESREQLLSQEKRLQQKFSNLVALIIEARSWQEEHLDAEEWEHGEIFNRASNLLQQELSRIYEFEGGREIMERAEQEALVKLDAYERKRLKCLERIRK